MLNMVKRVQNRVRLDIIIVPEQNYCLKDCQESH